MPRPPRARRQSAGPATPIVGVDVETACSTRGAVCALGVSVVLRGAVVRERHWYLDPGTRFDPRFIAIHGIKPADVAGEPLLASAWPSVEAFLRETLDELREPRLFGPDDGGVAPLYVAHNAQFDRMQIEQALRSPLPFRLTCTVAMSRRAFPRLERHNLAAVSSHLGIALKHHDALSDARACALIAHRCLANAARAPAKS